MQGTMTTYLTVPKTAWKPPSRKFMRRSKTLREASASAAMRKPLMAGSVSAISGKGTKSVSNNRPPFGRSGMSTKVYAFRKRSVYAAQGFIAMKLWLLSDLHLEYADLHQPLAIPEAD